MCFDTEALLCNERKINHMVTADNVSVEKSMIEERKFVKIVRIKQLSTHSRSDPNPYKCPDCNLKFSTCSQVCEHKSSAHKNPEELQPTSKIKEVVDNKLQLSCVQSKRINNHKCRICLNEFLRTTANLNDEKLHSIFISITGIDARKTPEISTLICDICERNVLQFRQFQDKCWESDIYQRLNGI